MGTLKKHMNSHHADENDNFTNLDASALVAIRDTFEDEDLTDNQFFCFGPEVSKL